METCERLGLGWSQWHINGPVQFERNWPILQDDAVAKGYAWVPEQDAATQSMPAPRVPSPPAAVH